jgi:hypothetical protein
MEIEKRIWEIFRECHGCKQSGEDCNFRLCNNFSMCSILVNKLFKEFLSYE